jgi:hypothetical protein
MINLNDDRIFSKNILLQARSGAQNPVPDRAGESDDKITCYTFLAQ